MAKKRIVIVRHVPGPDEPEDHRPILGRIVDPGDGSDPFGTNELVDRTIASDRRKQFERYYLGYSTGYTEYLPDVALSHPDQWARFITGLRGRRGDVDVKAEFQQFVDSLAA